MSQNGNPTTKTNEQLPNTTLQLVISWDQVTGAINVTGPIGNTVIAFGMMEAAKDVILKHIEKMKADSGGIVLAMPSPNLRM